MNLRDFTATHQVIDAEVCKPDDWDFDEIDFCDSLDILEETLTLLDDLIEDEKLGIPIALLVRLKKRRKKVFQFLDKFIVLNAVEEK